jgi:predicted nucleotidyltransferase
MEKEYIPDPDVILLGIVGSTAYGLSTPTSDHDRLGIFLAPTETVLGLGGAVATDSSRVSSNPDVSLHELGKFVKLGLKCNPTTIELLYLPTHEVTTETGKALVELRYSMLCEPAVRGSYGSYALHQARELLARHNQGKDGFASGDDRRIAKHARHCFRLLLMGTQLLRTGELTLDVSEHREEIFAVGELATKDPVAFTQRFEVAKEAFDAVTSVLPVHPNRELLEEFLVATRRNALN